MGRNSKVIIGVMLIMVVILSLILVLVLVLLAELYCSLLLRRRRQRKASFETATAATTTTTGTMTELFQLENQSNASSLSSFYSQGVLQAPRSFLFPTALSNRDNFDMEKQHPQVNASPVITDLSHTTHSVSETDRNGMPSVMTDLSHTTQSVSQTDRNSMPSVITDSRQVRPKLIQEVPFSSSTGTFNDTLSTGCYKEQIIYICNPVFDNEASRASGVDTPFETPGSSPSRLDTVDSSEDDDDDDAVDQSTTPLTPRLTPMKKLPAEACSTSLSLREAMSLGTSGSESISNNNGISSSSSSDSPCTSPSW